MDVKLRDTILSLQQEKIYSIYFGIPITDINWSTVNNWNKLKNPFREDKDPSLSFKWYGNKLIVRDWGDSAYSGDVFKVVGFILNMNCFNGEQFIKICEKIYNDYYKYKDLSTNEIVVLAREKEITTITCKFRTIMKRDYDFFLSFGITKHSVDKYVKAVSRYSVNDKLTGYKNSSKDPCYFYTINKYFTKLYFPNRNKKSVYPKFVTNNNLQLDDITDITPCNDIILVKSIKDKMLALQFLQTEKIDFNNDIRIHVCSSESSSLKSTIVDVLKHNCKCRIYSMFDADKTGIEGMEVLLKMYGIQPLYFSTNPKAKDPTDFYKEFGYAKTHNVFKQVFNNIINNRNGN